MGSWRVIFFLKLRIRGSEPGGNVGCFENTLNIYLSTHFAQFAPWGPMKKLYICYEPYTYTLIFLLSAISGDSMGVL